ncbi:MAG: hypothetical protein F6K14_19775 [Symploca sp. SIO2C1]|nr:hypothetical protein [Symploca sp. SIO2C1]
MINIYQKIAVVAAGTVFSLAVMEINREIKPAIIINSIGRASYQDWTTSNYVNLDSNFTLVDYLEGNYTYNDHNSIDYTLALTVR